MRVYYKGSIVVSQVTDPGSSPGTRTFGSLRHHYFTRDCLPRLSLFHKASKEYRCGRVEMKHFPHSQLPKKLKGRLPSFHWTIKMRQGTDRTRIRVLAIALSAFQWFLTYFYINPVVFQRPRTLLFCSSLFVQDCCTMSYKKGESVLQGVIYPLFNIDPVVLQRPLSLILLSCTALEKIFSVYTGLLYNRKLNWYGIKGGNFPFPT